MSIRQKPSLLKVPWLQKLSIKPTNNAMVSLVELKGLVNKMDRQDEPEERDSAQTSTELEQLELDEPRMDWELRARELALQLEAVQQSNEKLKQDFEDELSMRLYEHEEQLTRLEQEKQTLLHELSELQQKLPDLTVKQELKQALELLDYEKSLLKEQLDDSQRKVEESEAEVRLYRGKFKTLSEWNQTLKKENETLRMEMRKLQYQQTTDSAQDVDYLKAKIDNLMYDNEALKMALQEKERPYTADDMKQLKEKMRNFEESPPKRPMTASYLETDLNAELQQLFKTKVNSTLLTRKGELTAEYQRLPGNGRMRQRREQLENALDDIDHQISILKKKIRDHHMM